MTIKNGMIMAVNWNLRPYSQEEFIEAWATCSSVNSVCKKLNISKGTSTYFSLKVAAQELSLPDNPYGKSAKFKCNKAQRFTVEDYFIKSDKRTDTYILKRLIRQYSLKEFVCELCGIDEWLGKELNLHLDHINGNNKDNRLNNLRLLCPNCHSHTDTFMNKGKGWKHPVINTIPKNRKYKISNEDLFTKDSSYYRKDVRKRILNECLIPYQCAICELSVYEGKQLLLQLDHINGVHNDHRLENLRFLCANCHSQTDNYCSSNLKINNFPKIKSIKDDKYDLIIHYCVTCGENKVSKKGSNCLTCFKISQRKNIPSKENLSSIAYQHNCNLTSVGKEYGVSDNSVRKWLKSYDLPCKSKELREFLKNQFEDINN